MTDGHGGNIYRVARERRCGPSEVLDFSASINPLGLSLAALRALRKGLWAVHHYPDPEAHDLTMSLSKRLALPPEWILFGNGSAELIHHLPRALDFKQGLIIGPTFSEYERALRHAGVRHTYCHALREAQYRPPLAEAVGLLQDGSGYDALFLCNPNSPTGRVVAQEDLRSLLTVTMQAGIWTILDESFIEFCPEASMLDVIVAHPRLLLLRSFTKFYGMPGLRLGYLLGHPDVLDRVRRCQPPWSVNMLAQLAAVAVLKDSTYRRKTLAFVTEERARVLASLKPITHLQAFPSVANFILAEMDRPWRASEVAGRLRDAGMVIRDCSSIPGLNDRTIRFALKTRHENDRLLRALTALLHE